MKQERRTEGEGRGRGVGGGTVRAVSHVKVLFLAVPAGVEAGHTKADVGADLVPVKE